VVVTLQNGLGHRAALERAAGRGRVAVGVTMAGATLVGPGEVRTFGGPTVLGDEPATRPAVGRLAEELDVSGLPASLTTAIDGLVWGKLAVNCSANPLTALEGCRNGELIADPAGRARLRAAAREVGDVAAALGVALAGDPADAAVRACQATAGNRSSMLQDVQRGAPTEIDAINGAVAEAGERLRVPTHVNRTLWRLVRAAAAAGQEVPA
jgi:2-dehydropantoate 2-reductase